MFLRSGYLSLSFPDSLNLHLLKRRPGYIIVNLTCMLLKYFDCMCPLKRILTSSVVGLSRGNIYLSAFNKEMLQFFFVFNFKFC